MPGGLQHAAEEDPVRPLLMLLLLALPLHPAEGSSPGPSPPGFRPAKPEGAPAFAKPASAGGGRSAPSRESREGTGGRKSQRAAFPIPSPGGGGRSGGLKPEGARPLGEVARIRRVIDGDTAVTGEGVRVRYLGIDAPEVHHPRKPPGCLGREAAAYHRRLVQGREVLLLRDARDLDRYGRRLRYVHLLDGAGRPGLFVNAHLVREGWARAWLYRSDRAERGRILAAEAEARREGKGIWGAVCRGATGRGTPSRRASAPASPGAPD